MSYYNEFVGGPGGTGHMITRDSDWGQEFPQLAKYLQKNNIGKIELLGFGTARPSYYGIEYNVMDSDDLIEPKNKIYAISLRYLYVVQWADKYKPKAKIGNAIYVYDLRNLSNS